MAELVATMATVALVVLLGGAAVFFLRGEYFFAGFLLTLVAFAIYVRERNR
ncbi:MAG: hypothetical protein U5K70_05725 [Halodesulfurarchaeum sp.]|nr:hypothetical protein [Halodesulfurarchaeum sp.]